MDSDTERAEEKRTSGAPIPDELPSSGADVDLQVREARDGGRKERKRIEKGGVFWTLLICLNGF